MVQQGELKYKNYLYPKYILRWRVVTSETIDGVVSRTHGISNNIHPKLGIVF